MIKADQKKARPFARAGQAASELAVFGAILIFLLGTVVRSALGNGNTQNENFKAMRMAMLSSWEGSLAGNTNNSSASILFVEDKLSPDFNKYGDFDRSPSISNGSGTFTYELEYPLDPNEVTSMLPVMNVYIDSMLFPFTTASYVPDRILQQPASCGTGGPTPVPTSSEPALTQQQCLQNQCLRYAREWYGGSLSASNFQGMIPVTTTTPIDPSCGTVIPSTSAERTCQDELNGTNIFNALVDVGLISSQGVPNTVTGSAAQQMWSSIESQFPSAYAAIQQKVQSTKPQYKLFYSQAVNGTSQFLTTQLSCNSHPCVNNELSADVTIGGVQNTSAGDLNFDLQRNNIPSTFVSSNLRPYMAWQWYATAATIGGGDTSNGSNPMIGLNPTNNQYPQWDIDGRLKPVTIYSMWQDSAGTHLAYEDSQGGDIDGTWDKTSCGPKPGLQSNPSIYTFTKAGTYLLVKEGRAYNPETDQFVRSVNKRDTIDLIEHPIQLSNNTGRFCTPCSDGSLCGVNTPGQCANGTACNLVTQSSLNRCTGSGCANPNNVEMCTNSSTGGCYSANNITQTCMDTTSSTPMLYVRARIEDRRGRFWFTDTTGQLNVK